MAKLKAPNHLLRAEMSDDRENYDEAEQPIEAPAAAPTVTATPPVVVEAPAPAAPGVSPEMGAMLSALVQALQGGNQALIESLSAQAQAQAKAMEQVARQKMPENARDPEISVYNPWGDRDHPRPTIEGRVFVAQKRADTGAVERLWEEEPEMLTYDELLCLNALPGMGPTNVELTDGELIKVSVELLTNGEGKVEQRLILIPYGLMSKDNKANKNRWVGPRVAKQLLGPERTAAVLEAGRPKAVAA